MDHETSTLREHNRKKNLFFKRNERGKEKTPCVCTWAQTKRAIQHLQDEFQIENINKNYGHANVQASDKFVMRMRKRLTKRKMFRIFFFFFHTANATQLFDKEWISTLWVLCNFTEPQTIIHWYSSSSLCEVGGHWSSPPVYPRDVSLCSLSLQNITNDEGVLFFISNRLKEREEKRKP